MLEAGIIEPSSSNWASAPVLIKKKDNTVRWTVDFIILNQKTVKDCFPLPVIEDCLDTLQGNTYFSTLDLSSGYYQIKMADKDKKKQHSSLDMDYLNIQEWEWYFVMPRQHSRERCSWYLEEWSGHKYWCI